MAEIFAVDGVVRADALGAAPPARAGSAAGTQRAAGDAV